MAAHTAPFVDVLREMRERRRLSQSELALRAGFDHSYVSRLESGGRKPTASAVVALADALRLTDAERDALLASAGFMPHDPASLYAAEPVIQELIELLADRSVPALSREYVRQAVSLSVRVARSAQGMEQAA